MVRHLSWKSKVLVAAMTLGTVVQASCSTVAVESLAGLSTSVMNAYLRSVLSDWMGLAQGLPF